MVGGYSYYSNYCPEYRAVLNRGIELGYLLPSIGQQVAQDTLMRQLISSGIFGIQDLIYIFQNDCGIDFARINWKNPLLYNLTYTTLSPLWLRNIGMTAPSTSTDTNPFHLNTEYIPATNGVGWTLNNVGYYEANFSGYGGCGYSMWCQSGADNVNRAIKYLYDAFAGYNIHSATASGAITAAQHFGLHGVERTASTANRYLINGATLASNAGVSTSLSTDTLKLFGLTTSQPSNCPSYPIQFVSAGAFIGLALNASLSSYLQQYYNTFVYNTYDHAAGTRNYTVPDGVTELLIECWGGGGAGRGYTSVAQSTTGAGGGGGAYAASVIAVTPGAIIPYTVGAGGVGGTGAGGAGGTSSWNSGQVSAQGAQGGQGIASYNTPGGSAAASVGDVKFDGGVGGWQGPVLASTTGSGGSAAGPLGAGTPGINGTAGGTALRGRVQFSAGSPGYSQASTNANGVAGMFGSGGSGARRTTSSRLGGNGGVGYIRVSYHKQY